MPIERGELWTVASDRSAELRETVFQSYREGQITTQATAVAGGRRLSPVIGR
jgi:hypothetical protein